MSRRGFQVTMSNDDPNPKFRPQVDTLVTKLRQFSFLQHRPEAVEHIIEDLMYWYFVRQEERPKELFRVMILAEARWRMTMHLPPQEETEEMLKQAREALPAAEKKGEWLGPEYAQALADHLHLGGSDEEDRADQTTGEGTSTQGSGEEAPALVETGWLPENRCEMISSVSGKRCLLEKGHLAHSEVRFHYFGKKMKNG